MTDTDVIAQARANGFPTHADALALADALAAALTRADVAEALRDDAERERNDALERIEVMKAAIQAAIDCGMVPKSSAKEGGAVAYSEYVRVADRLRAALTGEPQP